MLKNIEAGDYSGAPILADALQDAGCDSEIILTHLRTEAAPGSWFLHYIRHPDFPSLVKSAESLKTFRSLNVSSSLNLLHWDTTAFAVALDRFSRRHEGLSARELSGLLPRNESVSGSLVLVVSR